MRRNMFSSQKKKRKVGRYGFLLVLLKVFISFRLYLPTAVKNHINQVLNDLSGYRGSVAEVDIALIRGAYAVKGLQLIRREADISMQWQALVNGKIV